MVRDVCKYHPFTTNGRDKNCFGTTSSKIPDVKNGTQKRYAETNIRFSELCLFYECLDKSPNIADFRFHTRSVGGFMHDDVRLHRERQR